MMMKIYLGTDHAGFALKETIKKWLEGLGYDVTDMGAYAFDEQDDYPEYSAAVARAVSEDPTNRRGIVLGGSGQGEAMVANRFSGIRAAVFYGGTPDIVKLSREHNDANILSLGARFVAKEEAKDMIRLWLTTPFSGEERHRRRLLQIAEIERTELKEQYRTEKQRLRRMITFRRILLVVASMSAVLIALDLLSAFSFSAQR